MVSYAQPLFWQIRYLITGLSKKNYKSSVSELHHLIALYGYDAQVFFLRTLIEEIQFQDAKHGGGGRDQLKVQLLQSELKEIEDEEQFGVVLCQAVEASRDGVLLEDFVTHLCKVAKVQLRAQLSFGVACLQSSAEATRREGAKFLRTKLREYTSPGGRVQLPEPLLHALLAALRSQAMEEVLDERDRDGISKQLMDLHPDVNMSHSPCAGLVHLQRMSPARLARHEKHTVIADLPLLAPAGGGSPGDGAPLDGVRACDLLEELGRGVGGNTQAVRDVLSLYPGIGARGLAEIICMSIRTTAAHTDPHSHLVAGVLTAAVRDAWNDLTAPNFNQVEASERGADGDAAGIIRAVKECVPEAPWTEAFDLIFDLPDLQLLDGSSFQALLSAHGAACTGASFPLGSAFKVRRNTAAQLRFLKHATGAEPSALDFTSLAESTVEPVPGLPGAEDSERIGGPNHCWACRPFLEILFELAEAEDYGAVRELFDAPLSSTPEALLLTICLTEDRSRGALRSELLEKLAPVLEDGSPHSTLVQATLAERAPTQFKQLFRSLLERDPERNLSKIMDILQKDELVSFYAGLLHGPPSELSCQLALLGSNKGALSLSSWLRETISEHKDVAALGFMRFVKARLQPPASGTPGKGEPGRPQAPYLPSGVDEQAMCKAYLDALQEASLSAEAARQVRELAQLAHERFPSLAPAPPPEAPPAPGPPPTAPPPGPPPSQQLSPEDLEESSNGYFSRLYTGEMTVLQLIEVMRDFAAHDRGSWKHEVYSRMIQNLFDECRFFPKYPPQELTTTGELFGLLINHDLVVTNNLGLALRCVLEAMRRPMHTKMFRFGIIALEQFLEKLPVWPQLCHHLTQIEHLAEAYPAYVDYAKAVLKALPEDLRHAPTLKPETLQGFTLPRPPAKSTQTGGQAQETTAAPAAASAPETPPAGSLPSQPPPKPPTTAAPKPPTGSPPAGPPPPPTSAPEGAPPPPLRTSSDSVLPPSPSGASKTPGDARPEAIGARAKVSATTATATGTGSAPGSGAPAAAPAANPAAAAVGGTLMFGGAHTVDTLLNDPELQIEKPPMWVCDLTAAIFNSLVKDNMDQKVEEMRGVIQPEYYPWLAYYLVKSRASKEVNFHATYIDFFERLKQPRLFEMVTNMTYDCLRVLLKSVDQAVVSTSHRTVLKNLGYWLGQITLARNKSLKSKQMDLKNALLDAYENGRLTAVLPLVCKVLEGVQKSKVYKLPNPWTAAVMNLLAEIHDVPNLRTNLMFEVEVLCKHLDIKISDLKRSDLLTGKRPHPNSNDLSSAARQPSDSKAEGGAAGKSGDAGGSGRTSEGGNGGSGGGPLLRGDAAAWPGGLGEGGKDDDAPRAPGGGLNSLGQGYHGYAGGDPLLPLLPSVAGLGGTGPERGGHSTAPGGGHGVMPGGSHHEEFIIPSLPSLVTITPSIALFQMQPQARSVVPHAVDRAIKEVISAVVERSVTISCLTTREMVTKDFAMEPDESVLKKAAQLMVSSVAGSLALVTCREPLRVSLTNHLWQLLMPHLPAKDMNETAALEQVVHILSTENLELGCNLIEKAVVDKALKDIEESIAPALQARKEHRMRNPTVPYYDTNYIQSTSKWPQALPDMLRPKVGPLSPQQLKVYKDFNTISAGTKARLPSGLPPLNVAGVTTSSSAPTAPPQEPPPFLPPQSAPHTSIGASLGLGGSAPAGGEALAGSGAAGGARLGYGPSEGLPDFDLSPSPRTRTGGVLQLSGDGGGLLADDGRLGKADVPLDVQAALTALVSSMEQVMQGLLSSPPLLPPIDATNINTYKQDDALEACTALSMLPLDHELVNLLRQVPHWLSQCSHQETCALDFAQRIFRRLYEVPQSVPQVHPPDTVSLMHAMMEIYLSVLDMLRESLKDQLAKVLLTWVDEISGMQRYNVDVISGILRYQLIGAAEFDRTLAKWIDARPRDAHGTVNAPAVDFAVMLLQRVCLRQRVLQGSDFQQTAEALLRESARSRQYQQLQMATPMSPQEVQLAESATKVIEELRSLEPLPAGQPRLAVSTRLAEREEEQHRQQRGAGADAAVSRELILNIFEEWHSLHDASPDSLQSETRRAGGQIYTAVLQRITSGGCIRSEEATERFFRVCCEHAVQRSLSETQQGGGDDEQRERQGEDQQESSDQAAPSMNFLAIDSFTRLIVLLMKFADKAQMLTRALVAIGQELMKEATVKGAQFNQRPYFRILLNLLMDVNQPDPNFEQATFQLLSAFCNAFHACNPLRVPNFAFAWLELISNRMFMPKLLMVKQQRGWLMFQRLLVQLLYFLEPYLRRVQLTDSTRLLYKGTVRMLLVLLHDFPEFLCDYHFSFCDIMPIPCVQIRNLILSAFPRNMKLPDPFMPNLKVDLLPEIKVAPRILSNYTTTLLQLNLKADVDSYMRTREKRLLETIKDKLRLPKRETLQLDTKYNVPLLNALLLYVGVHLPQHGKTLPGQGSLQQNNPSLEIFTYLAHNFDYEGRYLFLGAIANHLRYPNTHTHYFSCVLLYLFADTGDEVVREQITRVLLERLIVHRPHPWGLLITFIELIKNRRYEFWNHSFVKCAPEVEKLFQSVAYTCLGTTIDRQNEGEQQAA